MSAISEIDNELKKYGYNKHEREKEISKLKRKVKEELKRVVKACKLIKEDIETMYESFITQFYYSYQTTSYVRHDTGSKPGVDYGVNLYRANNVFVSSTPDGIGIGFNFNADDMKGYRYHAPKEEVLDYVLNGYRYKDEWGHEMLWSGTYKSKINSFIVTDATLSEALDEYGKQFTDLLFETMSKL